MAVLEILRIVFSLIYCLAGYAAFVTFLIIINYPAAVWAILTGICNTILTHLHTLKMTKSLENWYDNVQLDCSSRFGIAFFAVGTSGLVYHIAKQVMLKTPILPVEESEVIPAIWCFITLKSGLILLYYAKYYQVTDTEINDSLVTEEENEEKSDEANP